MDNFRYSNCVVVSILTIKTMHKQTFITIILVLVIIGLLSFVAFGSKGKNKDTTRVQNNQNISETLAISEKTSIFFYGNTCPHCEDVEEWMKENKIEEKIEIVKKEVYDDNANALELSRAAKSCGMDASSIGVPFLYTPEGKCLVGTPDIISYLGNKAGMSNDNQETKSGKETGL